MYREFRGRRKSDMVGQIRRTAKHAIGVSRALQAPCSVRRLPTFTFRALQLSHALRSLVFGSEGVCRVVGAGAWAGAC